LLYSAIDSAQAQGHIFVAAAGNNGTNTDSNPTYPAGFNLDNIVSVTATTSSDALASYSNYGVITVDLAAPGAGILSTRPFNKYSTSNGTSMATPFVTGALSLVWSLHPDWTYRQVIDQVFDSVDKFSGLQGKTATGGRLNIAGAVEGAAPSDTTSPRVVSAAASGPTSGGFNKVRVTFSEAINPASFTTGRVSLVKPGGQSVAIAGVQAVAGSNNKQFDVTFSTQTAAGTYTFSISSGVKDVAGNALAANQAVFQITRVFNHSSTSGVSILDKQPVASTIVVNDNVSIEKLEVKLDIDHTYDGDLYLHLQGPDGTDVTLVYRRGRSGNNFKGTVLTDGASLIVLQGTAPFSGNFRPEQSLSAFAGKNAKGVWKLWVEDQAWGDQGRLNSWELKITAANGTVTGGTIQSLASLDAVAAVQPANSPAASFAVPVVVDLSASSSLPAFGREQMELTQTMLAWQDVGTAPATPANPSLQSFLASLPVEANPPTVEQDDSTPRWRPLALYPEPVPSEEIEEDGSPSEADESSSKEGQSEESPPGEGEPTTAPPSGNGPN
jgi:subtilisin-like proprotein convertase family protein